MTSPRLSLGTRLENYRARRVHVSDFREPLVEALFWNRMEREARQDLADARMGYGDDAEQAEVDIAYARSRRIACLNRWRNGFDRQVSIAERGSRSIHEAA